MKSLKCDLCDFEAQAETFNDWTKAMRAHYTAEHADWMKEMAGRPNAKEEGEKWMAEAKAKFDVAKELNR